MEAEDDDNTAAGEQTEDTSVFQTGTNDKGNVKV